MKKIYFFPMLFIFVVMGLASCQTTSVPNQPQIDDGITDMYLENKGSDTMVNLALFWAERYQEIHANMRISVTGGGSGTGISSLISDTVDIANASRAIKDSEIKLAEANGVTPVEYVVARDAIGVIINTNNPINNLTLEQISAIYAGKINNWQELGGDNRPIVRLSRETNSGTHVYFLEAVIRLGNEDDKTIFSADTLLLPSSEGIIAEVRDNPNAIGYDGLGYITDDVKVVGVSNIGSDEFILPSVDTVNSNQYPIARDLYMYINGEPEPYVMDYLDWIYSDEGQEIVRELGFVPVKKD